MIAIPASSATAIAWQGVSDGFWLADQWAAPLLALLLLVSGWGARLFRAIERGMGGRLILSTAIFAAGFAVLLQLLRVPLDYLWVRAYDRAAGAATIAVGEWFPGQLRDSLALVAAFSAVAVVLHAPLALPPVLVAPRRRCGQCAGAARACRATVDALV